MATFDVTLTDGRSDWLVIVEAGSNREAHSKARWPYRFKGRPVEVKVCTKQSEPKAATRGVPPHVADALKQLQED